MRNLYTLLFSIVILGSAELLFGSKAFAQTSDLPPVVAKPVKVAKPSINTRKFYDYRGALRKNSIKIQPIALLYALKVSYERVVLRKLSVGANVAFYHGNIDMGSVKGEITAKYFLRYRAPLGVYAYTSHGFANISNHKFQYRYAQQTGEQQIALNPKTPLLIEQNASFSTYIGSVGLGFHNVLGPDRNIILDLGLGYQFYNVPEQYKVSVTKNGVNYGQFGANNFILGPTSALNARFAIGFMF